MAVRLKADNATSGRRIPPSFEYDVTTEFNFTVARITGDGGTVGSSTILRRWIADAINDGSYPYIAFDGAPIVGYKLVSGFVEKIYSIGRAPIDAVRDTADGSASVPLNTGTYSYPIVQLDNSHFFKLAGMPRGGLQAIFTVDGNVATYASGVFVDTVTGTVHEQYVGGGVTISVDTSTGRDDRCSLQGVPNFTSLSALDCVFGVFDPVHGRLLAGRNGVVGNQVAYTPNVFTSGTGTDTTTTTGSVFKWVELALLSGLPDLDTIKARSLSGFQRDRS